MAEETHSVLVVSKDTKLSSTVSVMLIPPLFETEVLSDFNEARRRVAERVYNIILVDYAEGKGADFAQDA
jgi:response regulator NasT